MGFELYMQTPFICLHKATQLPKCSCDMYIPRLRPDSTQSFMPPLMQTLTPYLFPCSSRPVYICFMLLFLFFFFFCIIRVACGNWILGYLRRQDVAIPCLPQFLLKAHRIPIVQAEQFFSRTYLSMSRPVGLPQGRCSQKHTKTLVFFYVKLYNSFSCSYVCG